ncbi:MAG: CDP-alcohol phosphatidyltransferase family protein [Candidatus Peregrinibacteria bacterium]
MKKVLNIPNSISILRTVILVPLTVYFFATGQNLTALIFSLTILALDVLDGYLARKLKQETPAGVFLDMIGDNLFIGAVVITFLIIGHINFVMFSLMAAQRVTRLAFASYIFINTKGFYKPLHMKLIGGLLFIYIFTIPFLLEYFSRPKTSAITYIAILTTYLALIISILVAFFRYKKDRLKVERD